MKKIILASTSPRRKEIFEKLRLPFEVQTNDYQEDMNLPLPPADLAEFLSEGKAKSVAQDNPEAIVIAADTFVVFQDKVLGKPKTEQEAIDTLKMLSGKENDLITGVTILENSANKKASFHEITKIFMKDFSEDEISAYVKTGEPMDKAGSYAIQDLGALFIEKIEGDFFNALGLPLSRLAQELRKFNIKILRGKL